MPKYYGAESNAELIEKLLKARERGPLCCILIRC